MGELATYLTLKNQSEGLYKEKGSKFIGLAVACYNEEEVKQKLEMWKQMHHQSRHLCYAYRFGLDGAVYRANDDGEPNNSAGAPILGQIDSFNLSNVLIGVVRYFGGTKLGVGGLITAYKTAAREAILNGEIIELEVFRWVRLHFDYTDMPHVMNLLKKNELESIDKKFEEVCELTVNLPLNKADFMCESLSAFSSLEINQLGVY